MAEIVVPNAVVRKPDCLYYIDGEGNLCEAQLKHRTREFDKPKKEDEKQNTN